MNTYLIVSETIYYIEEKLNELKKDIDNIVTFNLDNNTMDEVLEEASYFSMFNDTKLIIVKNAKFFGSSRSSDTNKVKEDATKLLKYLENENPSTKIVFIHNGKADSKKKIYSILNNIGNVFNFPNLTKTEMKNELYKMAKNKNYQIDDQCLWCIINNTLGNFDLAINELEKIMIYYGNPTVIKYTDVINLVALNIEDNNFKLVDSIVERDLETALKLLNDMKVLNIEPNIILSLIYREFKLMLSLILYEKNNCNYKEILSNLGLADWQYKKIKNNLRNYNEREIKEEILKISNLDYKLKSGLLNKDVMLINYILDICS